MYAYVDVKHTIGTIRNIMDTTAAVRSEEIALRRALPAYGQYQFDRFIGSGAEGSCFKLRKVNPQPGDRRHIVLKLIPPEEHQSDSEEALALQVSCWPDTCASLVMLTGMTDAERCFPCCPDAHN